MTERTRKTVVFGLLIAACVWGYANLSGRKAHHASVPVEAASQEDAISAGDADPATAPAPVANHVTPDVAAAYDAKPWGKNPFYHGHGQAAVLPEPQKQQLVLQLSGILYRESGAQAFINGRVVAVGDTILGYRITAITPDFVAVDNGAASLKLRVKKESS